MLRSVRSTTGRPAPESGRELEARRVEVGSGAWCWFADPRAVAVGGVTYVGWIDGAGDVRVAEVDGAGIVTTATLHAGLGVDDHNNPALLPRADGRLQAFYSAHGGPADVLPHRRRASRRWGPEQRAGDQHARPTRLHVSQPRPTRRPRAAGSTCSGAAATSTPRSRPRRRRDAGRRPRRSSGRRGQRPYVKVASDGRETIPWRSPTGIRARRRRACTTRATRAASGSRGRPPHRRRRRSAGRRRPGLGRGARRPAGLGARRRLRRDGRPRIVYAVFLSPTDHRYRHARWTGTAWEDREVTPRGRLLPRRGRRARVLGRHRLRPRAAAGRCISRAQVDGPVAGRALADAGRRRDVDPWLADGGVAREERPAGRGPRRRAAVAARPLRNYRRYRTAIVTD